MSLRQGLICEFRHARGKKKKLTEREWAGWVLWSDWSPNWIGLGIRITVEQVPYNFKEAVGEILERVKKEEEHAV